MEAHEYPRDQMQESMVLPEKAPDYDPGQAVAPPEPSAAEEAVAPAPSSEEERLWGIVNANPADFNSWTQLIQETEKLDDITKFRQCYDTFLAEFPLCYGYWKKYADHENRLATPEKVIEVYERAVKAVTFSVDIWVHYCLYVTLKPEDPEELRRLFERAISYVGTDYLAHQLWDKYIDFEYSLSNWVRITQLYTRILQTPLQALDRYMGYFKELAKNRPLAELKGPDEATELIFKDMEIPAPPPASGGGGEENEVSDPEVEKFIRRREALYKSTKEWDAKIQDFETAIKRPYFHVKPLDDMQLLNWHRYLDFLEKEADFDKVMKAYERCVIACANYPEYWIRYIHSMEAKGRHEIAEDALDRATRIFVKRRPEIHIYAARFKERRGDPAGARKEFNFLSSEIAPGLLEVISKHANFEKRQGNLEGACAVYESALEVEKAKEDSRVLPFLYVQYVRFLIEAGMVEKSKQTQSLALEKLPHSKVVLEAAIHFASISPGDKEIQKLDAIVERAISSAGPDASLTASDREEISSLFLEFVDFYGSVEDCKKAEVRHRQHFVYSRNNESKKRPSLDGGGADRSKLLKPGASVVNPAAGAAAATPATAATTPAAAAAGAYTNGQWSYQNWQQWNQAYPAGYNYSYQYPATTTAAAGAAQGYAAYPQTYQQQDGSWSTTAWS